MHSQFWASILMSVRSCLVNVNGRVFLGSVKHASRVTRYLADVTESLASRSGLAGLVRLLFNQYLRLGHPFVQHVDDAMGKRVIDAIVSILLLAEQQSEDKQTGILALEAGNNSDTVVDSCSSSAATPKLSYAERFQALLLGEVPRMEQMLADARRQAEEEAQANADEAARQAPAPLVMDLKDFVPMDEVIRLKEENKEQLRATSMEAVHMHNRLDDLTREKQRLEQRLTDVHNYQESERGRRFQDMEEELARTKLEANQKTHDLRKLEIVLQKLKSKRKSKSSSRKGDNQSNASESMPPSPEQKLRQNKPETKHKNFNNA
ncbi:hypothetical protein JM18_000524 [Phytophthora kernoviae]|uniref:Uncharacterized protein n=2 Tax=Phytophthora kernoviae TaxID=325452 RepID=A0A8T0MA67_9STRA|nr:hypothetical protein G195_001223 [Phytophthora kernoviae 00238/432]KAG2532222.1 hypothetical protein JM16_000445 [Phytophthora kernoviae]KAG2533280.1 hypothetical protein JM18_000524 [Phytophthora kernoviae]